MDYPKSYWVYTPIKEFTDYKLLRTMPKVSIDVNKSINKLADKTVITVDFKNSSDKIAFGIEALIVDKKTGESILPMFLDKNYFSLLPGETKTITAEVLEKDIKGKTPELKYSGINLK